MLRFDRSAWRGNSRTRRPNLLASVEADVSPTEYAILIQRLASVPVDDARHGYMRMLIDADFGL